MMLVDASQPLIQSPLVVTLIGVACVTMVTLAGAAVKIVVQLAKMQSDITSLHASIATLQSDPDVMRWSNYGRVTQAMVPQQHTPGVVQ